MKHSAATDRNYLPEVRDQYENYPYPFRNPEQEKEELKFSPTCALDGMNYYHYCGKRDFTKGFRTLVAGGGTGDSVIMLAEQFRGLDADIICLDISEASMNVAKERAKIRGLTNITWMHGSLLDAPKLLTGKFDYINCIGVLHHLQSPEAGLAALAKVLSDDGVMGIMLYAKHGREDVYRMQNLMRILNKDEKNMQAKVENCKVVLRNLPVVYQEIVENGDIGIYDLFLHSNDVAYTVAGVYDLLATSKLKPSHFFSGNDTRGNDLYAAETYFKDGVLPDGFSKLTLREKQAAAELMHGKITKHVFYAAKARRSPPSPDNLDNIPFFTMFMKPQAHKDISQFLLTHPMGEKVSIQLNYVESFFIKTPHSQPIFQHMDGHTSLRGIFDGVRACVAKGAKKPAVEELLREFKAIFRAFNTYDLMFLRDKSAPAVKTVHDIQSNLT